VVSRGVCFLAVTAAFLVAVGGAGAWTKLTSSPLDNTVDPSVVVLPNGAVAFAYREPRTRNLDVQIGSSKKTVAHGLPSVGDPQLLRLPDGSLLLVAAENTGVATYTSSNGGASWSGPVKTKSTDTGDVQAAAVRKDGTPLFSQDGTGFVNVYQGAGGDQVHNLFTPCCGYAESLAVDSHGLAQIAFWSNATGHGGYLYGKLDGNGALAGGLRTLSAGQTAERDDRVPLVADAKGDTFVAFANGYPSATSAVVETLHGGGTAHTVTLAHGSFTGSEPLLALAVDSGDRLWALWTQGGKLWGARSRSAGAHFGAAVGVALPGSAYGLEAAARPDGSVDAIVNGGSELEEQQLLPGLTVAATATSVRVLDDGFPVAGATVSGGGTSAKTGANGTATLELPIHTAVTVTAPGYTPASATTP
jgi:hypothetical protein